MMRGLPAPPPGLQLVAGLRPPRVANCVRCSSGCDNLENGGQADSRRQWLRPLTTDGQPCGEHLTHQLLHEPLRIPTPRPIIHSHLTEQAAVARATAGKVLASRCARQGQSTRRGMISPPVKCSTSTTWYLVRAAGSSSSYNCQRGYQLHPSRPGWPGAAWMACADKAPKVDGDGGAQACSSTPQAAGTSTLVALRPPPGS